MYISLCKYIYIYIHAYMHTYMPTYIYIYGYGISHPKTVFAF